MISIDQNSAITSLNKALKPSACLIDSRSEIDRLSFLTKFASLINFYDHKNKVNGNWAPFLLKDPIFLMASIATMPFHEKYLKYIKVSTECTKKIIDPREINIIIKLYRIEIPVLEKNENFKKVISNLNKIKEKKFKKIILIKIPINLIEVLFDQILNVFITIERWAYYLGKSDETYNLKYYIYDEIKNTYSKYLWAILSLKEYLSIHFTQDEVKEVNWSFFQSFDKEIWQLGKNNTPFWILFGFKNEKQQPNENNIYLYYRRLIEIGDQIFSFQNNIIEYASVEFASLKNKKDKFPDTLLLRTFTELLTIYENQLNGLSSKHLDFYFKDILKQQNNSAKADQVFVSTDLIEEDLTYTLPKNTLFLGGNYEDTTPILFNNEMPVSINPASIEKVYTVSKTNNQESTNIQDNYYLNITEHIDVNTVKKNEDDIIESWKTFGTTLNDTTKLVTLGFAFASPILFLQGGTRTITIEYTLNDDVIDKELFENAHYYLSTQSGWLDVTTKNCLNTDDKVVSIHNNVVTLTICILDTDPSIEAFIEPINSISSDWPICKMEFSNFKTAVEAPKITSLYIKVDVKGLKTFQLYNDFGQLETKNPFPLFGPTPEKDQSFIIGSNEIFSKRINTFTIQLDWDNLPQIGLDTLLDNFETYYEKYNNYLKGDYKKINKDASIASSIKSFIEGFLLGFSLGKKSVTDGNEFNEEDEKSRLGLFTNDCFKVTFQLLQSGGWIPVFMNSFQSNEDHSKPDEVPCPIVVVIEDDIIEEGPISLSLFQEIQEGKGSSIFNYTPGYNNQTDIDPTIQKEVLEFSDESTSGFFKMQLIAPLDGFGLLLYPKVISAIALYNAAIIAKLANNDSEEEIVEAPNEPYTPTVNLFTASYSSCVTYTFDESRTSYPVELFYYDMFCNYKIYDNTQGRLNNTLENKENEIPIYNDFTDNGKLFIALSNLVAPAAISLYFELTSTTNKNVVDSSKIIYNYLSKRGWKPLQILSDETYGLSCSGIVTITIPDDITLGHHTMPESSNAYYISIGVQDDINTYPETTFLKTNGIKLTRIDTKHLSNTEVPFLQANSIQTTFNGISELTNITQPFSSFGGVAAETDIQMDCRVSTRLKTKDRLVSRTDYYRIIKENFPSIYQVTSTYDRITERIKIYVSKEEDKYTDANAFRPYVTICKRLEIKDFLKNRTPIFAKVEVLNFEFKYIRVVADIYVKSGFEISGVKKIMNPKIDVFLSPWIHTTQQQITIGNGISAAQIALFIKSQKEIASIDNVFIEIGEIDPITKKINYSDPIKNQSSDSDNTLFVPSLDASKIQYLW
ncbi:hypothetical protein GCM10011344_35350 [Dokdonia pacifica]|uniref:Baseplate J-like protein n=1 Tax=Dokdonia pacifica TaxID=1627892 RepID=A0A239ARE3_9FLAO|nr:hypothetical protein [Dokdonia pacifica]GGG31352.1 hypothetical protein GCM10011344_35350 [Dokdonia pacifica]SNR98099.1 hypothetical protein SAMN06265376_10581 [Dokdonia pacifica]